MIRVWEVLKICTQPSARARSVGTFRTFFYIPVHLFYLRAHIKKVFLFTHISNKIKMIHFVEVWKNVWCFWGLQRAMLLLFGCQQLFLVYLFWQMNIILIKKFCFWFLNWRSYWSASGLKKLAAHRDKHAKSTQRGSLAEDGNQPRVLPTRFLELKNEGNNYSK